LCRTGHTEAPETNEIGEDIMITPTVFGEHLKVHFLKASLRSNTWWARQPLVPVRATVFATLVGSGFLRPENGPEEKWDVLARANAAKFVERLCTYPAVPNAVQNVENM
jgi:hypothetical protein